AMRPTIGVGEAWIAASRSSKRAEVGPPGAPLERSFRFAPAQNVEPSLVTTSARTAGSALAASIASSRPRISAAPSALRFSTSASVAVITPAALAMRTGSIVRGPPRVAPGRWRGPPPVTLRVRRCANRAPGLDEESMPLPALLAPPLRSQLDTRSETFAENRAAMLEKLAELDRLLDQAEAGGGAYHHERLAKRGKLPVRERIALALDPDSPFLEIS